MRLFGLTISRTKAASMSPVDNRGGWWPIVREPFGGAWQQNVEITLETSLASTAVMRCLSLISSDISKMRLRLVALDKDGIWIETATSAFNAVIRRPNRYQNRIQFYESWVLSKLIHGNTYALKQRDGRGVVTALYILDPLRTKPLVAHDGSVYYQLRRDDLTGITDDDVIVPAREIIHDRWNTFFHPLVGLSPLYAAGLAANQGVGIRKHSTTFFSNNAQPGGILTAPGAIADATAARLKAHWDANYTGANAGKVAVLGDGLKFEPMAFKASDSQLIEQLKLTDQAVCTVFGVPAYKVGVGQAPAYNNVEALDQQYYSGCLQPLIEAIELALDEGLELPAPYGTEFDLDDLLRMDSATLVKTLAEGVNGGLFSPNEGRKRLNLPPTKGGETPYLQQQNFSLAALSDRDKNDPFSKPADPPAAQPASNDNAPDVAAAYFGALMRKSLKVSR